jgi:hypothetical protein
MITEEQLLEVFATYNPQIWPLQIVAYLLGIASVVLAVRKTAFSARGIPAILAFFWLWVGLMFWLPSVLQGFTPGYFFTALFIIQGGLFLFYSLKPKFAFGVQNNAGAWAGMIIVLYALVGYPLVGALVGHTYPRMSPFGLTPCPVVTFTCGLLLLTEQKVPKGLLILPFLYTLTGIVWVSIGMWEDIGMILSGLAGTGWILYRDSRLPAVNQVETKPAPANGGWSLDIPDKKTTH